MKLANVKLAMRALGELASFDRLLGPSVVEDRDSVQHQLATKSQKFKIA